MSSVPVQQPPSTYTVAEANTGLDFSTAPSLPVAVVISGGGTIDFVDNKGGVTEGAALVAGRPYPWTIARVTACTGSGQVQFFFDLSTAAILGGWAADTIATLVARINALTNDVTTQASQIVDIQGVAAIGAIYRPGADPSGNVFATFGSALAALRVFGGGFLDVDDSGDSTAAVVEPGSYNLDGVTIRGFAYATPTLNIEEGASFSCPTTSQFAIYDVILKWAGATAPFSVASGNLGIAMDFYAQIIATSDATGPLFSADTTGNLYVDVGLQCSITTVSGGYAAFDLGTSGTAEMGFGPNSILGSNTITGGGAEALLVTDRTAGLTPGGGVASINHTQTGTTNPVFAP